jgi:esterase/lipase superfamily enzyme
VRKIHAIAHSMGNRVFLGAVRKYELDAGVRPPAKIFGHVALAAPDVDAATFAALLPSLVRQSETATLYYCQTDRALLASQTLHLNKPVGLSPFFAEGLDTINCDNANTSLLGHDYFASTHPLLIDLRLTILFDQKPDDRFPPLGRHTVQLGYPHWSFLPPR